MSLRFRSATCLAASLWAIAASPVAAATVQDDARCVLSLLSYASSNDDDPEGQDALYNMAMFFLGRLDVQADEVSPLLSEQAMAAENGDWELEATAMSCSDAYEQATAAALGGLAGSGQATE